jgi:hypothetical protein
MQRRTFLHHTGLTALSAALPWPSWAITLTPEARQVAGFSLAFNFCLLQVQKALAHGLTANGTVAQLLWPQMQQATAGNAFLAGKYGLDQPEMLYQKALNEHAEHPLSNNTRGQLAYVLGNLASHAFLTKLTESKAQQLVTDPDMAARADALVLQLFFMRKKADSTLTREALLGLLQTMVTRTYVRYHTLKGTDGEPLAWLETTIAQRKSMHAHLEKVAALCLAQPALSLPLEVFNPDDALMAKLSPGNNHRTITPELLQAYGENPGQFAALSQATLHAATVLAAL